MKRNILTDNHPSTTKQRLSGIDVIPEYVKLTSNTYDFTICSDETRGGKWVMSNIELSNDADILVESPLICWPLNCSVPWNSAKFCENCLKLVSDNHNNIEIKAYSKNNETLCFNAKKDSVSTISTKEEPVPSYGTFCSIECSRLAVSGMIPTDCLEKVSTQELGWFTVLGGSQGLRKLRAEDWEQSLRGTDNIVRATSPISLEAIARVLSSIASRYAVFMSLINLSTTANTSENDSTEWLLQKAAEPFQRLVAPAQESSEFDPVQASATLSTILHDPFTRYTNSYISGILLSPDTVAQVWGQLVLNTQRLTIWGSDIQSELCIIEGAGVYTLQSCFNHSCNPNCSTRCFTDSTLTVSTSTSVAPGEELTVAYVPIDLPVSERRRLLAEAYLFWCECERCKQETV